MFPHAIIIVKASIKNEEAVSKVPAIVTLTLSNYKIGGKQIGFILRQTECEDLMLLKQPFSFYSTSLLIIGHLFFIIVVYFLKS